MIHLDLRRELFSSQKYNKSSYSVFDSIDKVNWSKYECCDTWTLKLSAALSFKAAMHKTMKLFYLTLTKQNLKIHPCKNSPSLIVYGSLTWTLLYSGHLCAVTQGLSCILALNFAAWVLNFFGLIYWKTFPKEMCNF